MSGRLHVVALPHTTLTDRDLSCAYSQKVRRFCGMMRAQGYHVTLYGPDESDADADETVVIATRRDRKRWGFGGGFDTALTPFLWDAAQPYWAETNRLAASAVRDRAEPTDLLCLTTSTQSPVADANAALTVAEYGVGYEGIWERDRCFAAFESHAWRHHVYGLRGWRNGRAFDTVIPNFFRESDFRLAETKNDALLFMGRMVERKGPHIALEIAKRTGRHLVLAGPGGRDATEGAVTLADTDLTLEGDLEYVGEVGPDARASLLAAAAALLCPTVYVEPFGGVAVEAMLSGTPVVASAWGAFTETVTAETGATFSTLAEAEDALDYALSLKPAEIRAFAARRYTLNPVGARFAAWFEKLDSLWGDGWYS